MKQILQFRSKQILLSFSVMAFLVFFSTTLSAQVSGTVFRDLPVTGAVANVYGSEEANEQGVGGVTVTIYPGPITTTTMADGSWGPIGPAGAVRVEFSGWPSYLQESPDAGGANTSIQFSAGGTVDFGLHYPKDFSQTNPIIAVPRHRRGDPLLGGLAGPIDAFVGLNYNDSGDGTPGGAGPDYISLALAQEVGTVWGVAYQRESKTLLTSAVYRRLVGLGPQGTGGIYAVDFSGGAPGGVTNWLDVSTLGVNPGTDPRSLGTDLNADGSGLSFDYRAYEGPGKISLGDIDISDDEKTLYVVNLNERNVLAIDIATKTLIGTTPIPDPGCSNGDYRPWALKFHEGELYVGVVCTAETSQDVNDLTANVMKLDGGVFTSVFSFPLNYPRGHTHGAPVLVPAEWNPWTDDFFGVVLPAANLFNGRHRAQTLQPILSDIEFDIDGSLILGFIDRQSYQLSNGGYVPDPTLTDVTTLMASVAGGDVLRACPDGAGGWNIENDGSCGLLTSASGVGTGEGPGGGEFYHGDNYLNGAGDLVHDETASGGLGLLVGSGEITLSATGPINDRNRRGGLNWLDNTTGANLRGYEVEFADPLSQNKTGGLGDIEMLSDPAPIEIGNLVWNDTNSNGIQDPSESGIPGIIVKLFKADGTTLLATATTNGNGNYIFSNAPTGAVAGSHIYQIAMLMANQDYIVRIENASGGSQQGAIGAGNGLISASIGEGVNGGINNTDGIASGTDANAAVSAATIPIIGTNNHSFDFGFGPCPPVRCGTVITTKN